MIRKHLQIADSRLFFHESRYCAEITDIDATERLHRTDYTNFKCRLKWQLLITEIDVYIIRPAWLAIEPSSLQCLN